MRYPVVLLDVGGTLIGPQSTFGAVYSDLFASYGVHADAETFERAIYQVWDEMNRVVPDGENRYTHFADGEAGYWNRFVKQTVEVATGQEIGDRLTMDALQKLRKLFSEARSWHVFADVVPALQRLKEAGVRLGVVSNWDSQLPNVLDRLELTSWFETIVVSHFEGIEKPNPEIFRRALERMDVQPSEALHIGDSVELDGGGAKAAGIDWLCVDRHNDPPNKGFIGNFDRLHQIAVNGLASE